MTWQGCRVFFKLRIHLNEEKNLMTRTILASDPQAVQTAISVLSNSGLVAFPTDTVYGLASLTTDRISIERLYQAKGREQTKAIAVLLGDPSHLDRIALELPEKARLLARRFWPGALTLIVPRRPELPENLSPYPTVGVRMPNHPFALELLRETGPLATTSANLSGYPDAVTAQEVLSQLENRFDLLIDGGATPGGVPSTVVDCTKPDLPILRQGAITAEQIYTFLENS
jgi:L-threonylcarbamoyladenylate synthase